MAPCAQRLVQFFVVGLLAGLCASGTCSVAISTEHCCDHCTDCDDCGDCDGSCCDDFDAADSAPPPRFSEALLIDEDGGLHTVWALVIPGEGVALAMPSR